MNYIVLLENEKLDNKLQTSFDDIVCYKVIEERLSPSGRYEYKTFPMYEEIPEDAINGISLFRPKHLAEPKHLENGFIKFEAGFIHTYENMEDAIRYMEKQCVGYAETRPTIYRCVIPKGTQYYVTKNEYNSEESVPCFASLALRFEKPLLERVGGNTRDYKRMVKQEKKKKFGIIFNESQINGDVNIEE